MAKSPDNSQSPMKPSQLPLGENEALVATANKKIILKIARAVRSLGDLEVDKQSQQDIKERIQNVELTKRQRFTNCWKKVVRAVCCVLDVLQEPSHFLNGSHASSKDSTDKTDGSASSMQDTIDESKNEIMLRGLYHILGRQLNRYKRLIFTYTSTRSCITKEERLLLSRRVGLPHLHS